MNDCNLETIQSLYNELFHKDIDLKSVNDPKNQHDIVLKDLMLVVSKSKGIALYGAVEVDKHSCASAAIVLSKEGLHIGGSIENIPIAGLTTVKKVMLDIEYKHGQKFSVKFAGSVTVGSKDLDVAIYFQKQDNKIEYLAYVMYSGTLSLGELCKDIQGSPLDVELSNVQICVTNIENPSFDAIPKTYNDSIKQGKRILLQLALFISRLTRLQASLHMQRPLASSQSMTCCGSPTHNQLLSPSHLQVLHHSASRFISRTLPR